MWDQPSAGIGPISDTQNRKLRWNTVLVQKEKARWQPAVVEDEVENGETMNEETADEEIENMEPETRASAACKTSGHGVAMDIKLAGDTVGDRRVRETTQEAAKIYALAMQRVRSDPDDAVVKKSGAAKRKQAKQAAVMRILALMAVNTTIVDDVNPEYPWAIQWMREARRVVRKTRKLSSIRVQRTEIMETVEEDPTVSAGESAEGMETDDDGCRRQGESSPVGIQHVRVVSEEPRLPNARYRVVNELYTERLVVYRASQPLRLSRKQQRRRQQAVKKPMAEEQVPAVANCHLIEDDELPTTIMMI